MWALLEEPDGSKSKSPRSTHIHELNLAVLEKEKRVETILEPWILRFHLLDLVLGVAVVPLLFVWPLVGVLLPVIAGGAVRVLTARLALKLISQRVSVAMDHVVTTVQCGSSRDLIE
jgi:hypothetical protein